MYPPPFEYEAPPTLEEALALLEKSGPAAVVFAGGQSLIPALRLRHARPRKLIDIQHVPGLGELELSGDLLRIGSRVTVGRLWCSPDIASGLEILRDASERIADPLIRNLATVGGNICGGEPTNDLPACFLALGAHYHLASSSGARSVSSWDFHEGASPGPRPNEILTRVDVPRPGKGDGAAYEKFVRRPEDWTTAGVALAIRTAEDQVTQARVALTGFGERPHLARIAMEWLEGMSWKEVRPRELADRITREVEPRDDRRGPASFKVRVLRHLVATAWQRAIQRAGRDPGGLHDDRD
jgi:carbon-monoxide dehydrogenase medium subunit